MRSVLEQAEQCVSKISDEMHAAAEDVDVSWTTDCWSSSASDRYITTTLHYIDRNWTPVTRVLGTTVFNEAHTARNVSELMKSMRLKYGLRPKIPPGHEDDCGEDMWQAEHKYDRPCVTTDLGADISAGVEKDGLWDWNRCICHCLNLAVMAGTKEPAVSAALAQMRVLTILMKRSTREWSRFKKIQREWIEENRCEDAMETDGEEEIDATSEDEEEAEVNPICQQEIPSRPLRLLCPVKTRWNTWYYCLKRAVLLETPIRRYLEAEKKGKNSAEDGRLPTGMAMRTWRSPLL